MVVVVSKNECEAKAMKSLFLFIPMCIVFGFLNEWGKLNVNFYLRITAGDHWNDYSLDQKKLIVSEEMAKLKTAYYFQLVEKESFISMTRSDWMYWKWIVPITGTIIFFILEWFFLPLIFSGNGISRVYIIYYYSIVFSSRDDVYVVQVHGSSFMFDAGEKNMANCTKSLFVRVIVVLPIN